MSAAWGPGVGCQLDSQLLSHPCGHPVSWRHHPCSEAWKLVVLLPLTLWPAVPRAPDSSGFMLPAPSTCLSPPPNRNKHSTAWHPANRQLEGLHVNHSTTQGQQCPPPPQDRSRLGPPSTPAQSWDTCTPGSHPHAPAASITPLCCQNTAQG